MRYGRLINHPDGEAASMLHWSAGWRRLLDLPKLSPILHELFGGAPGSGCEPDPQPPNFRMDHMYLQRLREGFPGGRLHGGPRLNDQPGWYYEKRAGRSFNGLTTVVFELLPVEANGGGFCCIPVSARFVSDSLSLSLWILTAARERTGYAQERPRDGAGLARQPPAAGEGYGRRLREHRHGPSECARGLLPTRRRNHFHRAPQGPTPPSLTRRSNHHGAR
eukprot:COSAG04_NODE_984_length_9007_cov_4.572631_4_plen_221_part_00